MQDFEDRQPVLTSHEFIAKSVGPRHGKQRYDVERSSNGQPTGRTRDHVINRGQARSEKPRAPRPPKPQLFCHDQLLRSYKGSMITVVFALNDVEAEVKLIDCDRYSLLIAAETGRELIFKSSLASILFPNPMAAAAA